MMFEISPELDREFKKIKKRDSKLASKIEKQLRLFSQDEWHPSLRLHKLNGEHKDVWSMSVDMKIRLLYTMEDGTAYFFDLGTHDQVYK